MRERTSGRSWRWNDSSADVFSHQERKPVNAKVEAARLAFAEALLVIPQTLAESAGMDVMDVTVRLSNEPTLGVDVHEMELVPMSVFEPLGVVRSALTSAVENGVSLLRTHSVIMAKPIQEIFADAEK